MKFKIILLLALALLSAGTYSHAQAEKSITIYMENGDEKELKIKIPSEVASRADEYVKAYTMLYMECWNNGVGANYPYMFDIGRFKNTTPPKRITALAGNAAENTFWSGELRTKVALEARTYLNDLKYTGDQNIKEVEVEIGSPRYRPYVKKTVQIPERFRTRSAEYARGYRAEFIYTWNEMARTKNTEGLVPMGAFFDNPPSSDLIFGGDIKNYIKKLFRTEEIREEIDPLLDAHIEEERALETERRKKRAEERDLFELR